MLVARVIPGEDEESPATLGYTKHYYAGTQRVSSKIGTTENLGDFLQDWFTQGTGGPVDVVGSSHGVLANAEEGVIQVYTELGIEPVPRWCAIASRSLRNIQYPAIAKYGINQ